MCAFRQWPMVNRSVRALGGMRSARGDARAPRRPQGHVAGVCRIALGSKSPT